MSFCITFGYNNNLCKYIFSYLLMKLLFYYLFEHSFLEIIKKHSEEVFIFTEDILFYFGIFFFSLILLLYIIKKENQKARTMPGNNNKISSIIFIYNENNIYNTEVSKKSVIFTILLFMISTQLKYIFFSLNFSGIDFWMFEIVFICIITTIIFKSPIYNYKKLSIVIIIFSALFKFLFTLEILKSDENKTLYKDYIYLLPIGIIFYIFVSFMRAYALCKMKYLFDVKYISEIRFLVWYGSMGAIICFFGGIISTFIPCVNNNSFDGINYICKVNLNKGKNNILYYDHFLVFFKSIWSSKSFWINILYILLLIFKLVIIFLIYLLKMKIIKVFNPEYLICSNNFFYFIRFSENIISSFFSNQINSNIIYNYLAQILAFLGSFIYLELVQLNFCSLNYYLKKSINKRGKDESNVQYLYEDESSNNSSLIFE